jgi:hypothetical protein
VRHAARVRERERAQQPRRECAQQLPARCARGGGGALAAAVEQGLQPGRRRGRLEARQQHAEGLEALEAVHEPDGCGGREGVVGGRG